MSMCLYLRIASFISGAPYMQLYSIENTSNLLSFQLLKYSKFLSGWRLCPQRILLWKPPFSGYAPEMTQHMSVQ